MSAVPRVSVGLPVYNGEKHISESIDALLGQTFEDFELIISDNASTDATSAAIFPWKSEPRVPETRPTQTSVL